MQKSRHEEAVENSRDDALQGDRRSPRDLTFHPGSIGNRGDGLIYAGTRQLLRATIL